MRFDADQLARLSKALIDLADIHDRNRVHVSDSLGCVYIDVDGELVRVSSEHSTDDDARTYFVEVQAR